MADAREERRRQNALHVCFSVLMLCDWLILTWHLPTLERAIKPLSGELIERVTQIAHIWGFKEGGSNENNIVCTRVFVPQPLNLLSYSRAPLLPNIRTTTTSQHFDLCVWLMPLLIKCCHFPLATQTKLNYVSPLQVCPTFHAFFCEKSLSDEMRWWAKVQYPFNTKWFTRRKTKILNCYYGIVGCVDLRDSGY